MNQVIVIKLDGISYGIDVKVVQEVVYNYTERMLPDAPNFIEGLAYVREQLLPIIKTKRLFGSSFFDLYGQKKILVLSFYDFMSKKGVIGDYDTSIVGISVDEVVGIESFTNEDIKHVPSVYNTAISREILGFIRRRDVDIALLNIVDFFLDNQGVFRYQKYLSKGVTEEQYFLTKSDLAIISKSMEGVLPFDKLTRGRVLSYLSHLALFEGKSVSDILSSQPDFFQTNIHAQKDMGGMKLFHNFVDYYVMVDYVESQIKAGRRDFQVYVFETQNSAMAESLVLLMESLRRDKTRYTVSRISLNSSGEKNEKRIFSRENLEAVTAEMLQRYFQKEEQGYSLLPTYQKNIRDMNPSDWEGLPVESKANFVYAPNLLLSYPNDVLSHLGMMEKFSRKGSLLILGLFEDIEDFVKSYKKYYIKNRLVFVKDRE